jgi:hypothetical protein
VCSAGGSFLFPDTEFETPGKRVVVAASEELGFPAASFAGCGRVRKKEARNFETGRSQKTPVPVARVDFRVHAAVINLTTQENHKKKPAFYSGVV